MSDIKCPFCHQELDTDNYFVHCHNPECNITVEMEGTEEMWEALIRTRKALDVAWDGLKSAHEYYMYCAKDKTLQNNAGLVGFGMDNTIAKALEQITALEQKDK